jgi:CRP-like cAMP-binding protein
MKIKPDQEKQALEILKGLELFAGCSPEQLQAVAALLDFRELLKGKVAMMDQEIGRTLYILASGKVGIWKRVGGEKKLLATLEAPTFFGERTMFEESPASALVKAEENCTVFALERLMFDQVAGKFPGIGETIRKNMETVRAKRIGPTARVQEEGN